MLKHATRFPEELFTGSPATMQALRAGIASAAGAMTGPVAEGNCDVLAAKAEQRANVARRH